MRKAFLAACAAWLAVSLACNFPVATARPPIFATPAPAGSESPQPPTMPPAGPSAAPPTPAAPGGSPAPETLPAPGESFAYQTQPGDTLAALAGRFGVPAEQISSSQAIPPQGPIPAGQLLLIPNSFDALPELEPALPDGEVIYSPTSLDFDVQAYITQAGGFLAGYSQEVEGQHLSGAAVVQKVAGETSTNPRLLLAVIEQRSGWVRDTPPSPDLQQPLGFQVTGYDGLYLQLSLAGKLLNIGYYGWRQGTLPEIKFAGGGSARLDPRLNPGTAALQYLYARLYRQDEWHARLYGKDGLIAAYMEMFGDPWSRAAAAGPLFPAPLPEPTLELPFAEGEAWSLTAGPHAAWNTGTPTGALDFGPITGEPACAASRAWVRASAAGVIARAGQGVVILDLDGDSREQTGWVLLYQHIAAQERVQPGTRVNAGDPLGHPSCEGGEATGSHVHLARRYNGEWIPANGDWPLVLSGWLTVPGEKPYLGALVKGDQVVTASSSGRTGSKIVR